MAQRTRSSFALDVGHLEEDEMKPDVVYYDEIKEFTQEQWDVLVAYKYPRIGDLVSMGIVVDSPRVEALVPLEPTLYPNHLMGHDDDGKPILSE